MRIRRSRQLALAVWLVAALLALPGLFAATWFVRPDGGTRYSTAVPAGQCNGLADAAYPGKGVNQPCAFNDVRSFWTDGARCTDVEPASTCWRWVGSGGDTYLIRGSLADGKSYRVGQTGPNPNEYYGLAGNPYGAGAPPPPSGTASAHTRILGEHYASCSNAQARTQLHGGYGVVSVLSLRGASYVDVACLDITDFSSCGRSAQTLGCTTSYPLSDYADTGLTWSNTSTHDTLENVRIHGMASLGMRGPTGDAVAMHGIELVGNAGGGWNADAGDGTTGSGSLLVQHFDISWNGCAEEYPIVHASPYADCTDDNVGGYGDGFGTATVASVPAWHARFEDGTVSYNTQDGLDTLHLTGTGSSTTVTNTRAFGNMGQQIKIGGSGGAITHNKIFTSCNALRQAIPGTPPGYNHRLTDFCRAADTGVVLSVGQNGTSVFSDNVLYSASATALEIVVDKVCSAPTCVLRQQRNIFLGFRNNKENGYADGGVGDFSNPVYASEDAVYRNPASTFDHNVTFHAKRTWKCPSLSFREKNALCSDPHLADETWPLYGTVDTTPTRPLPWQHAQNSQPQTPWIWVSMGFVVLTFGIAGNNLRLQLQASKQDPLPRTET